MTEQLSEKQMIAGVYEKLKDFDGSAVMLHIHDQKKLNQRFCNTSDVVLGENGGDGMVHELRKITRIMKILERLAWVVTICACTTLIGWLVIKAVEKLTS